MSGNRICGIMQPAYFPWMGYFNMINSVDRFVLLDDVQHEKNDWQSRNRIKTQQGELYLSISRRKNKGQSLTFICDTEINDQPRWREKHIKSIEHAYLKSPFFDEVFDFIKSLIMSDCIKLGEFNINIIKSIARKIGITTEIFVASELDGIDGIKDHRIVKICNALDCDVYLSAPGASVYLEKNSPGGELVKNNIDLVYHNYSHPTYPQLYGDFLPHMCILDLLFNVGFDRALDVIKAGNLEPIPYMEFRKQMDI